MYFKNLSLILITNTEIVKINTKFSSQFFLTREILRYNSFFNQYFNI